MLRLSDVLRHPFGGYALAVGAAVVTTVVMLALRPFVHPFVSPPFLFLVLVVARKLGLGPAVAAAAVSIAAFAVLFVTPDDPVITEEAELAATVLFLIALVIGWLAATVRSREPRVALLARDPAASPDPVRAHPEQLAARAHSLRAQLAATRAALQAMERDAHDRETAARERAAVLHELGELERIVDDLLDAAPASTTRAAALGGRSATP